jgi:hypothetical protein
MVFTRRSILTAIARSSGLALAFAGRSIFASAPASSIQQSAQRLRSLIRDPNSARAIGRIYLREVPAEQDPEMLTRLILPFMALDAEEAARLDRAALAARFAATVQADFGNGRTIGVHGWILSRTEVRLCALWA